jgi:hypothetical protein
MFDLWLSAFAVYGRLSVIGVMRTQKVMKSIFSILCCKYKNIGEKLNRPLLTWTTVALGFLWFFIGESEEAPLPACLKFPCKILICN